MASTFSWAQFTGSGATGQGVGLMGTASGTGVSWDFEVADQTGSTNFTANPVSAGSASYPVWLKGYWSNSAAGFTVSNIKFWGWVPASSAYPTGSMTVFGTNQSAYSQATATSTGTAYASNSAVPTSSSSTASPAAPLLSFGTFGSTGSGSGYSQSWVVLQLSVQTGVPAGTSGYAGFTLQYDEQ